jgi:hypothetical protein
MSHLDFLKVYQFDNKLRLGNFGDGGYVFGELNTTYDCYISAGVSNEESFSRDFINKYNMKKENNFAFDGTIVDYPYNYTNEITFLKKNINTFNDDNNTNLFFLIEKYNNIFLKMDIEGGEYPWLLSINEEQLNKFKQITIEFHGINDDTWGYSYDNKKKCFEKLANTHYLIHAHGNNWAGTTNNIPDVIELTYVNKNCFDSIPNLNINSLPIANLDFPNNTFVPDIDLNFASPVKNNIPNIIHFCFGLIEQTEPFFFTYYLAILSAKLVNNPDKIYFYYHYEPYGKWWELIKQHIILEKIDVPTHIGSKPVLKTANKADIVRMNKLYERGGVYFDIDTISIRPYAELLKYNCVLGWEVENERTCNAIMFTEPNSKFFTIWLEQYEKHFVPEGWIEACNILPGTLAKDINDENVIKLLPPDYFFRPFFDETQNIFENNVDIPNKLHSLHLWETFSLKYLRIIDIDWIYSNKHTLYSKMVFELINNYNLIKHLIQLT